MAVPSGDAVEPVLLVYQARAVLDRAALRRAAAPSRPGRRRRPRGRARRSSVGHAARRFGGHAGRSDARGRISDGGRSLRRSHRRSGGHPEAGGGRAATWVERDGRPFAVLVHDAVVLDEPALVQAVAAATRLSAANEALLGDVHRQRDELIASRRRLVLAALDERRRLAARVRSGVEQQVIGVADALRPGRRFE